MLCCRHKKATTSDKQLHFVRDTGLSPRGRKMRQHLTWPLRAFKRNWLHGDHRDQRSHTMFVCVFSNLLATNNIRVKYGSIEGERWLPLPSFLGRGRGGCFSSFVWVMLFFHLIFGWCCLPSFIGVVLLYPPPSGGDVVVLLLWMVLLSPSPLSLLELDVKRK